MISPSDKFATALAQSTITYRWLVLLISLLLVFSAGFGMSKLEFSNNYRVFFSDENPELTTFENFQETYSKTDTIIFILQAPDGKILTPEITASIEELTKAAWQIPFATRVDSITNFQYTYAEDDDLIVEDLIEDAANLSQEELSRKEALAIAEPLLRGNLISPTADTVAVSATLYFPEKDLTEVPTAVAYAREISAAFQEKHPDVHVAISGIAMLNNAFGEASQTDIKTLIPTMYILLIIMTLIVLRSFFGSISTLVIIALSSITAMGLAGHLGIKLTPVSVSAPTIIMTLAIADSIHILVSMLSAYRKGANKNDAIIESVRLNFVPVTMTSLTTLIGFLTLNFSDAPPFWHLGNITAMGITAAWLLSLILLPAMLSILPIQAPGKQSPDWPSLKMAQMAEWVIAKQRHLLLIGAIFTLSLTAAAPTIVFNDEFIKYFGEEIQFRRDADFMAEHLSGVYVIEHSIGSGEKDGINNPEYLKHLKAMTEWLRKQDEVKHVYSHTDIMQRLNRNMHNDDEQWYKLPDNRDLAAQYLLLYEFSLPFGFDMQNRISLDKSSTRLTTVVKNISSVELQDFNDKAEQWMLDNFPLEMRAKATGTTVMFAYISKRNITSMLTGNMIAIFAISAIMLVLLRSIPLGFVSLLANTLPIIMMFGVWALLVGQVGMVGSTVAAGTLGIVVDDTVHFLTKYLRAIREQGMSRPDAIRYTFETVGVAIVSTTVILVVGFSVLMLSSFQLNSQTGLMSAITIVLALLFDFLFLPAVLLIGHKNKTTSH